MGQGARLCGLHWLCRCLRRLPWRKSRLKVFLRRAVQGFRLQRELDKSQHALAAPEPGKARAYFIQDARAFTTNFGVDGAWVGANNGNSYFSVSIEPGLHHLCTDIEPRLAGHQMGLLHFAAGRVRRITFARVC